MSDAPGEILLEASGLSVKYGRRVALDGFSLKVAAGEVVGMLGPNGAGKSTSLLAMAGAVARAAGTVKIAGVDSDAEPLRARAALGLCDQPPTMYEFLTVAEHLEFVAETRGKPGDAHIKDLIAELALAPVAERPIRELSFGYRQRVGLAAALAGDTRVVLLDETLNGLDPHAARAARETLTHAAKGGAAIVMSTHLLAVAERLCTRLLFVDKGKLVRDVAGDELEALLARGVGAVEELYLSLVSAEAA